MTQLRKKTPTTSKKPVDATAATPLMKDLADPAPFFSLGAAQFGDAIVVTKVVSVVLPLRHLRDKTIMHEMVLKKLLHRSFEPSAEDLAQRKESNTDTAYFAPSTSPSLADAVYVIVHIASAEIHADTARQVNPQGDVQVNVMTTLIAARVQHGLIAGVAEPSAFASCVQVRLPTVFVSADVAAAAMHNSNSKGDTDAVNLDALKLEGEGLDSEAKLLQSQAVTKESSSTDRQLRVTARCLEDEPVVPGQSVLLVSEPAAMRCLAVRPPRDAPGPFFFAEDVVVGPTSAELAAKKTTRRTSSKNTESGQESAETQNTSTSVGGRRLVVIGCDVQKPAGKSDGARKRPRT